MVQVGVHVSIAGSLDKAVERALERGCDCFQIFTKNPRGWMAKDISLEDSAKFRKSVCNSPISPIYAHMPYLPNLASDKPDLYQKSVDALTRELHRCSLLDIPYLVTHLGHAGDNPESGRIRVIAAIQEAISQEEGKTRLLLENTAGERNSVGSSFRDIRQVLDGVGEPRRIGVCLDTCHAFAAGYDIRSEPVVSDMVDGMKEQFGVSDIHLIHLNDAKGDLGSGLDRHEHLGCGSIGELGIRAILHHPDLRSIPVICETPVDERRDDAENIRVARYLAG
ncbi:MAG: deoxyribonuclease IV [Methanobacteriota archaeon]